MWRARGTLETNGVFAQPRAEHNQQSRFFIANMQWPKALSGRRPSWRPKLVGNNDRVKIKFFTLV